MTPRKIYFIRHASTEGNESNTFQHGHTELSENGLKQAKFLAERFKIIPINIIITSDMKRASQTAEVIGKTIGKEVVHNNLFQEILRPSVVRGRKKDDPEVIEIIDQVRANFNEPNHHHSDEENFHDLKNRTLKCLEYINSLNKENILIVTHGTLLHMIVAVMIYGNSVLLKDFELLQRFLATTNTGITVVEECKGEYRLLTWNDYAHLEDVDIKNV